MNGTVFDVQRFSVHDGPGIRTVVFLKGCPLNCFWCHNPESKCRVPDIGYVPGLCLGCGSCAAVCEAGCHRLEGDRHVFARMGCRRCGACAEACPTDALETIGRETDVESLIAEAVRDRPFYEATGGGLTLSGGEPLAQPAFAAALLSAAKQAGLSACLETCGFADWTDLRSVAALADMVLYDIKESDTDRHRAGTGVPLEPIVANLLRLSETGIRLELRCPIIPGWNDRDGHWQGLAGLAARLRGLEGIRLMPYHPMGASKAERIGLDSANMPKDFPEPDTVATWVRTLQALTDVPVGSG